LASVATYDEELPEVVFPEDHYRVNNDHHLTRSNRVGSTRKPVQK